MSHLQQAFSVAVLVVMVPLVTGLLVRRLYRLCYTFPVYLLAVLSLEFLILTWPSRFFSAGFWVTKETVYAALKCAMALELGTLAFQVFPGARARAQTLALVVFLGTFVALLAGGRSGAKDLASFVMDLQSRLTNGTALLFAALWMLVLWYQIPLHRLHRAILRGLVPYLLVFTTGVRLVVTLGWDVRQVASYADASAYLLMIGYWTWEAWRREEELGARAAVLRTLQPWRDRL